MAKYKSETEKILPKIEKYLDGTILDIGCGNHKIKNHAIGVDMNPNADIVLYNRNDIYELHRLIPCKFDVIYSSHCLEHVQYDLDALRSWIALMDIRGTLILYLPDGDFYNNSKNPDHVHDYKYEKFLNRFKYEFQDMVVIDSFMHLEKECYSFCIIAKKK